MRVLGIIPARGGSKRVIGKNTKLLNGKPLIQYALESAKNSKLLTDFVVSSDDLEIIETVRQLGYEVPFVRPKDLAQDSTGDKPVIEHALEWFAKNKIFFDAVIYLRPTAPFRNAKMIDEIIEQLDKSQINAVRSVTKVEGVHHPYWMFKGNEEKILQPLDPEISIEKYYQSQLLPTVYRLNGVLDILRTDNLKNSESSIYGKNIGYYEIEEQAAYDIDTEFDFKMCEALLKIDENQ